MQDDTLDIFKDARAQITHLISDEAKTNESGRRFARGCDKHLAAFGFLSEKQLVMLRLIYENSVESL
jgi:hypothetical protein